MLLFVRSTAAPVLLTEKECMTLVPAGLLAVARARILTVPAATSRPAARTFSNCTVPPPLLVMNRLAAVNPPVSARLAPVATENVVSSLS